MKSNRVHPFVGSEVLIDLSKCLESVLRRMRLTKHAGPVCTNAYLYLLGTTPAAPRRNLDRTRGGFGCGRDTLTQWTIVLVSMCVDYE